MKTYSLNCKTVTKTYDSFQFIDDILALFLINFTKISSLEQLFIFYSIVLNFAGRKWKIIG